MLIKRELYMKQIRGFMDKPIIKVITGMRRSGKSILLKLICEELEQKGVPGDHIIYMNFESMQYADITDFQALYQLVKRKADTVQGRIYILLDEIQDITNWQKAVNSFLVDFDCDIYITGSNARLLSSELATYISGRYVEIRIYPLSFAEYIEFTRSNQAEEHLSREQNFLNFLKYGGLPGIHLMKWDPEQIYQYLSDIYNSILLKDVISRNSIRDTALLEKIILYMMDNVGNTFSAKTISDFIKSQGRKLSTETVYNYIRALEGAFIIHKVPRYDIKGKRILETQEKYFFSDLGLRHAVMGYRNADIAGVLENVVYLELLRRGYKVSIGKQDTKEIDFIAELRDERLYVQVSYLLVDEKVIEREFVPLKAIKDNYEKVVLSMDSYFDSNIEGIKRKNIVDFLLEK